MKIKINYDLLKTTDLSEKGISIDKIISKSLFKGLTWAVPGELMVTFCPDKKETLIASSCLIGAYAIYPVLNVLYHNLYKDEYKQEFNDELDTIINKLKSLNIYTNKDLLKQARLITKSYKGDINSIIPNIKEKKHIEIPVIDNNVIELVQEHNIGSKDYALSIPKANIKMKTISSNQNYIKR